MKAQFLIVPLLLLTACSGPRGCSGGHSHSLNRTSNDVATELSLHTPVSPPPSSPISTPVATPDPLTGLRSQLVAQIAKLTDSECDTLVLQFQLVPRDEILNPLSEPRKDLLRYVRRIARNDELKDLEREINNRKRPSPEELDAMRRTKENRRQ